MLSQWLDQSGDLQRQSNAIDAIGGTTQTWSTVSASFPLAIWPKDSGIVRTFARVDLVGTHCVVTDSDLGARPGDRVHIGGAYYLVNGFEKFGNAAFSAETVYVLDVTRRTT